MMVVFSPPPNFNEIIAAFPLAGKGGVIFAYGNVLHNPFRCVISEALMAHETVHSVQHRPDPAAWWRRYIADVEFRFDQELAAHAAEYATASRGLMRPGRRAVLRDVAKKLSHPLYGSMTTSEKAAALIKRSMIGNLATVGARSD